MEMRGTTDIDGMLGLLEQCSHAVASLMTDVDSKPLTHMPHKHE